MSIRPTIPTKKVVTPSGITVTLKTRQAYGDTKAIYSAVFGDRSVKADTTESDITMHEATEMITITVARMIVDWDVTEEDGTIIPFTQENMEEIFDNADITFLMGEIQGGVADPKV